MDWLCVHLPRLSLDALRRRDPDARCLATIESQGSRRLIHDRDPEAEALGVQPGMSLGTAYALAPHLRALPRDPVAEARGLDEVALQAYRLSSRVCIETPDRVLVEIARSRRLLADQPLAGFFDVPDYDLRMAIAPTPRAAALLARAGRYRSIGNLLRLDRIPLECSELPPDVVRALGNVGIRCVRDLRALPRDGVRRRFGRDTLDYLDALTGRRSEPLPWFEPPVEFSSSLELMEETDRADALLFGSSRLVRELCRFLEARDLAVQAMHLQLDHAHGERTTLKIGLVEPDRRSERLIELLRERIDQLALPAPVRALHLEASQPIAFGTRNGDLFDTAPEVDDHAWGRLLERLRARLGETSVHTLSVVADHSPEAAWTARAPGTPAPNEASPLPAATRPLWLLHEPRPIAPAALAIEQGPERIETGWWRDQDIARDYYVARDDAGCRLWVFRECRGERGWFVHGLFS
ncbi:MAG: DNA polymerase Y family protein [Pseudomonadota bacterium]